MTIIVTEAELALITEALARYENDDDGAADALYRRLTAATCTDTIQSQGEKEK